MEINNTEDTLNRLKKDELINLVLHIMQDNVTSKVESLTKQISDILELNKKLEADVAVCKAANNALKTQIVELQRVSWSNSQYSRRESLEVAGISEDVLYKDLEKLCSA